MIYLIFALKIIAAIASIAVVGFFSLFFMWAIYLAVMNLYRAREAKTLSLWANRFGKPLLYFGLFIDFLGNMIWLTIIMLELPREYLVTQRLERHLKSGAGWRYEIAKWACSNLLDAYDPKGCHCDRS